MTHGADAASRPVKRSRTEPLPRTRAARSKLNSLPNPNNWPLGEVVAELGFTTDAKGDALMSLSLGVGAYRAMLETQDRFGKKVTARLPIQVLNPDDTKLTAKIPHLLNAPKWGLEPC